MAKNIDKNSYSYYKTLYRANRRNYEKRGDEITTAMLTKDEWDFARQSVSNSELVWDQFHKYSKKTIQGFMERFGHSNNMNYGVNFYRIAKGDFTAEEKEELKETYKRYKAKYDNPVELYAEYAKIWGSP